MDEDDYFVDRYDCPKSISTTTTTTTAKINNKNNVLDTTTIITENISPPSSLDVNDITSMTKINDDEPYEYDDYFDQLYATTTTTTTSSLNHNDDDHQHSKIVDPSTDGGVDGDTLSYEEYLRDIWQQLNVGHDGYLTVDELYRVCEHIGMNISNDQIIEQLFDRLDSDQDGRVSLAEFVDGLFQYIHHQSNLQHTSSSVPESPNHHPHQLHYQSTITNEISSSPSIDDNRIQKNSIVPPAAIVSHHHQHNNQNRNLQLSSSPLPPLSSSLTNLFNLLSNYSNFLTIKSDKDGYTESGILIDLWESLGFNNDVDVVVENNGDDLNDENCDEIIIIDDMENTQMFLQQKQQQCISNNNNNNNQMIKSTNRIIDEQQQQKQKHIESSSIGEHILKLFGYGGSFGRIQRIHIQQLWSQMLEYILAIRQSTNHHYSSQQLYQVSLATILNEFAQLKIQHDQMIGKCERLELQLEQANCRAEFLAQEVDEQHLRLENASNTKLATLEKKYQDQIKLLEMDFSREKEIMIIQSNHLRQDIDKQMNTVKEQLSKFRSNIKLLEEENKRLENDCQLIKCQNSELIKNFMDIQRHVEESDHLNAKIAELESMENAQDRKNIEQLMNEMEKLKEQNKRLQDQNDELLIEKESLRQQLATFILASYQHQQQQNSNQQTSQQQQQTLLTTTTAANQSSIFSSSSFTPESIIMAPTDEIMMMIESGGILPKFPSITTTTGRSKKRKRRRRRKKNKNKTITPNNNDNEQIEMNTTVNVQIDNNNNNDMNHNHDDKDKKQDNIVDTSMSSDNISTKTNPKTEIKPMMNNTGLPEEDQSSTFSTITTHGDDFDEDDDLDMDDDMDIEDDYDDFHQQTELVSSWTFKQRHKRIRQPNSNMYEEAVEEEGKLDDLDDNDDDEDDDEDNLQTLIQNHPSTTYIRSLSDEINFDRSRPIFANQPDQSSLEKNLQMILNQIIQDNHSIKENNDDFSSRIFNDNDNEMILKRALRRIENALKQIDNNNNSNDDQLMVVDKQQSSSISQFDHNNNPNP